MVERIFAFPPSQSSIQDDDKFRKLWILASQFFKRRSNQTTYLKKGEGVKIAPSLHPPPGYGSAIIAQFFKDRCMWGFTNFIKRSKKYKNYFLLFLTAKVGHVTQVFTSIFKGLSKI